MPKQGVFAFAFGWFVDGFAALFVASTVSFMSTDVERVLHLLSSVPLAEGESTVAREFCPDVVKELQNIRQYDPSGTVIVDDAKTMQLQAVLKFAENCRRRADYEAHLRREKGLGPQVPVSVPAPGVPIDFPFTEDLPNETAGGQNDFDSYHPTKQEGSEEWADSFAENGK